MDLEHQIGRVAAKTSKARNAEKRATGRMIALRMKGTTNWTGRRCR